MSYEPFQRVFVVSVVAVDVIFIRVVVGINCIVVAVIGVVVVIDVEVVVINWIVVAFNIGVVIICVVVVIEVVFVLIFVVVDIDWCCSRHSHIDAVIVCGHRPKYSSCCSFPFVSFPL